ncbi:MAG: flagellar biosynthesis regulator FlhF [Robiginitomaculum sp.]|nr:MAG: flagellar biosynthesis regulator FlhF [Robiginitomaculum sp.]
MQNSEMAKRGYATSQKQVASETELELKVFTGITGRLAAVDIKAPGGPTDLAEAVTDNARLWNLLFIDMTHKGNTLPLELKNGLLYLAEFTRLHTIKVLNGEAEVGILIEINRSIIAGKRAQLESTQEAA